MATNEEWNQMNRTKPLQFQDPGELIEETSHTGLSLTFFIFCSSTSLRSVVTFRCFEQLGGPFDVLLLPVDCVLKDAMNLPETGAKTSKKTGRVILDHGKCICSV